MTRGTTQGTGGTPQGTGGTPQDTRGTGGRMAQLVPSTGYPGDQPPPTLGTTPVEPARLAASKQPELAPQGPGRPRQPKGSRNGGKHVTTGSGLVFRNFLADNFFSGQAPTGQK